MKKLLNPIFFAHLAFFVLVVMGVIPRQFVVYEAAVLALWLLLAPLEEGLVFFVRSIPLFIAVPLTASYDNFNMWRLFIIILFFKWLFGPGWKWMMDKQKLFFKKPF